MIKGFSTPVNVLKKGCVYLQWGERIVFQEGQPDDWHQQELHAESVILRVVRIPEAHVDQVHSSIGQRQEHHLRAERNIDHWP